MLTPLRFLLCLVPVSMIAVSSLLAAPQISVSPTPLTAEVVSGAQGSVNLRINNTGDQALHWTARVLEERADLESVRDELNANFTSVTSLIPNRFDFSEGVTGSRINDGGLDMFDFGNRLATNLGSNIQYSDNVIITDPRVGPQGRYFTRKHPGLFVFAADLDNATSFTIFGGTGHDGGGTANGTVLTATRAGIPHQAFVKRVFGETEPSVNHIIIVENKPGASHTFPTGTFTDQHDISGLSGTTRLYHLLYGGTNGAFINDAETGAIFKAFLDVAFPGPPAWITLGTSSGTVPSAGGADLTVSLDATNLEPGTYEAKIEIESTDPNNLKLIVPVALTVSHALDFVPDELVVSVVMEATVSRTVTVTNQRNQPISWTLESQTDLESTRTAINSNFQTVTDEIPNLFPFTDGVTGTSIADGGNDLFDGGNSLGTNLGFSIPYSDDVVATSNLLGAGSQYFTRKFDGLFLLVADLNGVSQFQISGNLGHDGAGTANGTVLTASGGGTVFKGFVKRVFGTTNNPSLNHLIIVEDTPGLAHTFSTNTNSDQHSVTGLAGTTRLYYLMYAGTNGTFINDAETQAIMEAFLGATQGLPGWLSTPSETGTIGSLATESIRLDFSASGLDHRTYDHVLSFGTTVGSPEEVGRLPVTFTVTPSLVADPTGIVASVQSGSTSSLSLTLQNVGSQVLTWSLLDRDLESVLENLNDNSSTITEVIPNRFDFSEGDNSGSQSINDGGSNMFDGGNILRTSLGGTSNISYSENVIRDGTQVGAGGRYFTRKFPGLFVFAADIDGVDFFEIIGNLGANGAGSVDGAVLTSTAGGSTFKGFVKRVFGATVPSVNHLFIVEDVPGLSQIFSSNTDDDRHLLFGLSASTRLYYLLYGGTAGAFISDSETQRIMDAFLGAAEARWLDVSPSSGRLDPGNSVPVQVPVDAAQLLPGTQLSRSFDFEFGHSFLTSIPYTIDVTVSANPFQQWIMDGFTPLELANPSLESTVWGAGASLDGDIFPNIFEFFHGLNLHQPDFVPQMVQGTSNGKATFSFLKRKDTGGVEFDVEVASSRTGPFSPLPAANIVTSSIDADFDMVTATDILSVSRTTPRFGKLTVRSSVGGGEEFESETLCTVCVDVAGHTGSSGSTFTSFSIGTVQQKVYSGVIDSVGANTLTDAAAAWAGAGFDAPTHYAVITSGPNEGHMATIVSHTADTLTLMDDLSGLSPAPAQGETFEIRTYNSIGNIFGESNAAGLGEGSNGNDADNVILLNPSGEIERYFYSDLTSLPGWLDVTFMSSADAVIHNEEGVMIARKASQSQSFYPQGAIRTSKAVVPIEQGFNLVGTMRTGGAIRLVDLGLVSPTADPNEGLAPGVNANDADNVLILESDGSLSRYFHNGTEWLSVTFQAANGVSIEPGRAFFVHRKPRAGFPASANAFTWTVPQE